MAEKMRKKGTVRVKTFTVETSTTVAHVCRGMVDLARYLLSKGNSYVILGWFTTDPLEKCFSKLRQGSGGTYFISAQSVLEKVSIQKTKLLLQHEIALDSEPGHQCQICLRPLNEEECEIVDSLSALEEKLKSDTMMTLVYIAGYVVRHDDIDSSSVSYYEQYRAYFDSVNRGGLRVPNDDIVQWAAFCFILFNTISKGDLCRNFVMTCFQYVGEKYDFCVTEKNCRTLANIFLKNMALFQTPRSSKEEKLKVLELAHEK